MKNFRSTAIAVAWLTFLPAVAFAAPAAQTTHSKSTAPKAKHAATHAMKGVIKTVDDKTLVVSQKPGSGHEMTFVIDPSTEKVGTMSVGSTVDVRYRTEAKRHIATAVTVVSDKSKT
jgi:hypothetical protein